MKFDTGAIRDDELIPVRWDLISGIALTRVALVCSTDPLSSLSYSAMEFVDLAIEEIYKFIGGDRSSPCLALAFRNVAYGIHLLDSSNQSILNSPGRTGIPYHALRRLAATMEEGRSKYGEWNWLYGFPVSSLCSHALDHLFSICHGDISEDHWGHALANLMFAIHFEQTRPDLMINMLGPDYTLTDEIKQTLELQREKTDESRLGESTLEQDGRAKTRGDRNIDRSGISRAINQARGGEPSTQRIGFA